MVSSVKCPISGMVHRQFGLVFVTFLLLLADFSGSHPVCQQGGKLGVGDGAAPQH